MARLFPTEEQIALASLLGIVNRMKEECMARLFPTNKQIAFASSLGIFVTSSVTARQLSELINEVLDEKKRTDDERVQQANDTDMLELASNYTTLKKQSWRYHCGPCPMSGCSAATDGFVVDTHHNSWFCRKCNDKGTSIGFLIKRENLSFWDAVAELVGESYVPLVPAEKRVPVKKKEAVFLWGKDKWQQEAQRMVWMSSQQLMGGGCDAHLVRSSFDQSLSMSMVTKSEQRLVSHSDCDLARNYLTHKRAISLATARAWRLGQKRIKFKNWQTDQYEQANAIIIPWMGPNGLIKAIQYRFLDGASRRFHSKYGGEKTIYGAHLLAPSPDKLLVIVEGEFNAISIWQEAHQMDLPIDVISIGGEGIGDERLSSLVKLVKRYHGCIAWLDRAEVAQKVGSYLFGAMLLKSPGGHDANRLAQSDQLAGVVKTIYEDFAQEQVYASVAAPVPITPVEPSQEIYDLLNDAGWAMQDLHGEAEAQGMELYKQLEDTLENNDIETALQLNAQIKSLATGQAWVVMGAAQREKYNVLYL